MKESFATLPVSYLSGPSIEGEDHDRADLELPGMQKQLLLDVMENGIGLTKILQIKEKGIECDTVIQAVS